MKLLKKKKIWKNIKNLLIKHIDYDEPNEYNNSFEEEK